MDNQGMNNEFRRHLPIRFGDDGALLSGVDPMDDDLMPWAMPEQHKSAHWHIVEKS
jgi:hypothetical protein